MIRPLICKRFGHRWTPRVNTTRFVCERDECRRCGLRRTLHATSIHNCGHFGGVGRGSLHGAIVTEIRR